MPTKIAIGLGSKISTPASGTIKKSSASTVGRLSLKSKASSSKTESTSRTESTPATEIVSLIDFIRTHEDPSHLTQYGQYFAALNSIHSITTEDVKYVVDKSLENDPAGLWSGLKKSADNSIDDAQDFIEDLANLLDKIERAEISLDIGRSGDVDLQSAASEYLSPKLKKYEIRAGERTFEAGAMYPIAFQWTGAETIQSLLTGIRQDLTLENFPKYKENIINTLAQKSDSDLNASAAGTHFRKLAQVSNSSSGRLVAFATVLSQVMSLSSGIDRVKNDPIASKISFDESRLDAIFKGSNRGDRIPYVGKLNKSIGSSVVSLSMLQLNSRDGKTVVPLALQDPADETFTSGPSTMIRGALAQGDYSFSDFSDYCAQFEENRADIEKYMDLLLGRCDPENNLTPVEVFRIVIKYFVKALEEAESSLLSKYEITIFKHASKSSFAKQHVLRSAGRVKYLQLVGSVSSSPYGDESSYKTTLSTSRISIGESIKDDAEVSTTQTENKDPKRPTRIIERLASDSPKSTEMADSMYNVLESIAVDGPPTKQEINAKIKKLREDLERYDKELIAAAATAGVAVVGGVVAGIFTFGIGGIAAGAAAAAALAAVAYLQVKIESTKERIKSREEALAGAPTYNDKEDVKGYLYDATLSTTGTSTACLVNAYNEIIDLAVKRLPEGRTLTAPDGTTKFGNFDEFGLLSLIVEMFCIMSSGIDATISKDSRGNLLITDLDGATIRALKFELNSLTPDSEELRIDSILCDDAPDVKSAMSQLLSVSSRGQNLQALLAAFSSVMKKSKDDLIAGVANILETPARRSRFDNDRGRKLMSTLTSQQVIYRRFLFDKYLPVPEAGYLPACVVHSESDDLALKKLLSSKKFSEKKSENTRIAFVAVPRGTVTEGIKYVNKDLGDVNYSGLLELAVRKKDEELDDLIFKDVTYLVDQSLYVTPGAFSNLQITKRQISSDIVLELAKQCKFKLYTKSAAEDLDFQGIKDHSRYSRIDSRKKEEIAKNAVLSYLLELYVFKATGSVFDESVSLDLNDSISQQSIQALLAASGLNLPDLKLPTAGQINGLLTDGELDFSFEDGILTTGEKELISSLTDSYLMKSETPIDRLTSVPAFDRILAIAIDPDDFEIDKSKTTKTFGSVGVAMLRALQRSNLIIGTDNNLKVIPREPQSGGFSISTFTCQFVPHTLNSNGASIFKLHQDGKMSAKLQKNDSASSQSKINKIQSSTMTFKTSQVKR